MTMKQISTNWDNKVKAFQDKLASGKVKITTSIPISNKMTLYTAAEALQST